MTILADLLKENDYLILDGAMGTMLMSAGLSQGHAPEAWNVDHPDRVRAVHREYIEAGSQLVLTNSFGGNQFRLERHGLGGRVAELNEAAAVNARAAATAAPRRVLVGGSIGPSGEFMEPMGNLTFEAARNAFAEQAAALAKGGVDLLWIETMSDLEEVRAAVEGAQAACDLPIAVTMTFDTKGRTMMGVKPEQFLSVLLDYNPVALGANCGNGPDEIEAVIETMHSLGLQIPLIAKANAGLPRREGEQLIFDGTPEVMAAYACRARTLGASLVGACCGSTPAHIRAIAEALGSS